MSHFQLFPSPSPERGSKNPFRKGMRKSTDNVQPGSPVALERIKDSHKTESVLLQIIEDTPAAPAKPPTAPVCRTKSPAKKDKTLTPASSPSLANRGPDFKEPNQRKSPRCSPSDSSISGHDVFSVASPPVPMRSMFPRFNPELPIDKQDYRPQRPVEAPETRPRKPQLTLAVTSEIDQVLGPKTVPASVLDFPAGVLEAEEIHYSSLQELEMLWEAANGQRPLDLCGAFNLRMSRTGPATFVFGECERPFYTLETFSNDELAISRGAPSNPNSNVPIMTLGLEPRSRREHPNDGLVALLFSRLAAMLAIEQAEEISKEHSLAGSEAADVESRALRRAAAQESCRLSWNRNLRLYELRHPSLSSTKPPALVGAAGIPLSPVRSQSSGMLHITVSSPSNDASPQQPPTIIVTGPVSSTAMEAAQQAATVRTSTLPVTDMDEPLVTLDLATRTLSIAPVAVIATIPSLYAIDSLIAAVLAVAVSDEATNPILADMEGDSPQSIKPVKACERNYSMPFRGPLITTVAEREDYKESMQLASQIEAAHFDSGSPPKRKLFLKFWNQKRSRSPDGQRNSKHKKQIMVEEFDLEKYGRYGRSSSREGKKLPGITRTILKILFFGLNMVVKGLTLVVKMVAWLLVNSTRCVTSERF